MRGEEENNLLSLILQIAMYEFGGKGGRGGGGSRDARRARPVRQTEKPGQQNVYLSRPLRPNLLLMNPALYSWWPGGDVSANVSRAVEQRSFGKRRPEIGGPPSSQFPSSDPSLPRVSSGTYGSLSFPRKAHWLVSCSTTVLSLSLLLDSFAWCRFIVSSK